MGSLAVVVVGTGGEESVSFVGIAPVSGIGRFAQSGLDEAFGRVAPPFLMMSVCTIYVEGAPSLRFLQEPALSGAEGAGNDAADTTFVALQPGRACVPDSRPLQSAQRTGHPLCFWRQRGQKPGAARRLKEASRTLRQPEQAPAPHPAQDHSPWPPWNASGSPVSRQFGLHGYGPD